MAFELAVRGDLALPERVLEGGYLGIRDGRIVAVGVGAPPDAAETVDASGKLVFPGFVDGQVHAGSAEGIEGLGLTDYLAERFAVAGTVDDCVAKLNGAIEAGARQFSMSIHFDDKERFLRAWQAVIAAFR